MELDLVHADAMHFGFGLGQDGENRAGARGDCRIQSHGRNRGADRGQSDVSVVVAVRVFRFGGQADIEAFPAQGPVMVRQQVAVRARGQADSGQRGVQPRAEPRKRIEQRGDEHVAGDAAYRIKV